MVFDRTGSAASTDPTRAAPIPTTVKINKIKIDVLFILPPFI
jgi:hypothetical protein